jgi:hypothetical protein
LSSKAGAGGVILMFEGALLSLLALTAMAGLNIASEIESASRAKNTRVVIDFLISILLLE